MRLILMRHAKSSWDDITQPDHARPLNDRGIAGARAMGDWLRARGCLPDQVLCSTSTRTRQTLDLLGLDAPVRFEDRLYHAAPDTLLQALREAEGASVLILAHNPGIAAFAARMVASPPVHPRFRDYPTCATLVARFDIAAWDAVTPGTGIAEDFAVPRDLPGQA